jgi:cytochrome P450
MTSTPLPMVPFLRTGLDPVPELGALRSELPIHRVELADGPTTWLVTRHREVRAVLSDTTTFSNDLGRLDGSPELRAAARNDGGLAFRDPPQHTELRRLLTKEFTTRRLRRLRHRIEQIVTEHLDALEQAGPPADLVTAFAVPIPSLVISELLGIPDDERAEFLSHSHDRFDFSAGADASFAAATTSVDHLQQIVARARTHPTDGLLGALVREHADAIGDREIAGLADGLLTGGHDTTSSMLALGALWLLNNPRHAASIRDDDTRVVPFVEELLRYLSVVQVSFPRFARHDTVLAGQPIAAGDMVVCSLVAANRDPDLTARPDQADPDHPSTTHLAFGYGPHHCIGAPLARMQLRIVYPALLRRLPTLRLAIPADELSFRPISLVYGIETLPVTW